MAQGREEGDGKRAGLMRGAFIYPADLGGCRGGSIELIIVVKIVYILAGMTTAQTEGDLSWRNPKTLKKWKPY